MSQEMETRTVNMPRTGTKVSLIIAASLLAVAVYYYTTPTYFEGKDGGLFGCGSPMKPNRAPLGREQCHMLENGGMHKAILFLALALIAAILGFLLFGMEKSEQRRGERRRLDESGDDDHDAEGHAGEHEDDDEDHLGRRSSLLSGRSERGRSRGRGERAARHGRGQDDDGEPTRTSRRPRLGDEDEFDDDHGSTRRRLSRSERDDEGDLSDDREERPRSGSSRRGGRYDADAFDAPRD